MKGKVFTYQTEISLDEEQDRSLSYMAKHLSYVERCLFAEYSKGRSLASCKNEFLEKHKISARHFNAIRSSLEGKIASIAALNDESIEKLKRSLSKLNQTIKKIQKEIANAKSLLSSVEIETLDGTSIEFHKKPDSKESLRLHKAQRSKIRVEHKLAHLLQEKKEGKVSLCFGSKKLFRKQFHLEENGYASHAEWYADFQESRNRAFFTIGSKDESGGNQTCQLFCQENGLLGLHLRLANAVMTKDKYVTIQDISFAYGEEVIRKAMEGCERRKVFKNKKDPSYVFFGQAISFRFQRKAPGRWTLFVTTSMEAPAVTTKNKGAIGIDINTDHLALVEIDAQGNPIHKESIPLPVYGKSRMQTQAIVGDAIAKVVDYAKSVSKPVVLEDLDFSQKKEELSTLPNSSYNRLLSSFAYSNIIKMTESRGYREGVEVFSVDPAFTSVMGRVKYATRYGLSIHQSAALCIARRKIGFTEKIPTHLDHIPDGEGGFIALALPARNVLSPKTLSWGLISKKLKAGLAAHFRTKRKPRSQPKTGDPGIPGSKFTEEARYANR